MARTDHLVSADRAVVTVKVDRPARRVSAVDPAVDTAVATARRVAWVAARVATAARLGSAVAATALRIWVATLAPAALAARAVPTNKEVSAHRAATVAAAVAMANKAATKLFRRVPIHVC